MSTYKPRASVIKQYRGNLLKYKLYLTVIYGHFRLNYFRMFFYKYHGNDCSNSVLYHWNLLKYFDNYNGNINYDIKAY